MKQPFTDSRILQTPKAGSVLALGILFVCGSAAAQVTASRIEQIDAASGRNGPTAPIQQVSSPTPTRTIIAPPRPVDRKSVVKGKSVAIRVVIGVRRIFKKKKKKIDTL